jgi:hypothetical protein
MSTFMRKLQKNKHEKASNIIIQLIVPTKKHTLISLAYMRYRGTNLFPCYLRQLSYLIPHLTSYFKLLCIC